MKVVLAGDDLRLALGNALHTIAPLACGFEPGLDRFESRVDRERAVESGEARQFFEKRGQLVGVDRARGDREPLRLRDQRLHDARIRVTEAHRRIRREHVEVTPSVFIPQPDAFAVRHHHGKRLIVVRAVATLGFDERRARNSESDRTGDRTGAVAGAEIGFHALVSFDSGVAPPFRWKYDGALFVRARRRCTHLRKAKRLRSLRDPDLRRMHADQEKMRGCFASTCTGILPLLCVTRCCSAK